MKTILLAATALCGPARAFADLNFDATTVTPDAGFEPLPAGWYNAAIDESEMKPTADGTGAYLKLRFNILDGQYAGRKIFTNLNLRNSNQQTVEIAQRQLSAICHAVEVLKPGKSEELHGKPLKIKLKFRKAEGNYSEGNDITSYKSVKEQVDMAGGDAGNGGAAFGAGQPQAPAGFGAGAPAQPLASTLADPSAAPAQPAGWAPGTTGAPAQPEAAPQAPPPPTPAPPPAPAPAPVHDPIAAAVADGWIAHPSAPGYHYKGQDVKLDADVAALYPAPAAAPVAPPAPPVPGAPAAPAGDPAAAQTAPPPWAK